jgi:zinc transporter 9
MTLSQSQLRLISTIGMGVLVGTSLIVIIPEGIEAVYTASSGGHSHGKRTALQRSLEARIPASSAPVANIMPDLQPREVLGADVYTSEALTGPLVPRIEVKSTRETTDEETGGQEGKEAQKETSETAPAEGEGEKEESGHGYIGLALILGFILMFLIDKLPRHASENLQPMSTPRHISLDNLSQGLHGSSESSMDEDSESFLHSLAPSPKQSRSLATTTGLVIHSAADGIAMGASASTSNQKLGFIIFLAIMVHKAPAAFGLTSVLLKQGLSKRAARGHLIIFSLAAPFGALSTWLLVHILGGGSGLHGENGQWWTGMLLLFSAGTFL